MLLQLGDREVAFLSSLSIENGGWIVLDIWEMNIWLSLLIQAMHYFQIDKVRQHVSALVAGGASDM